MSFDYAHHSYCMVTCHDFSFIVTKPRTSSRTQHILKCSVNRYNIIALKYPKLSYHNKVYSLELFHKIIINPLEDLAVQWFLFVGLRNNFSIFKNNLFFPFSLHRISYGIPANSFCENIATNLLA